MKSFSDYQYLDGDQTERDKKESKSKFWGKGKWDNFILPLLPKDCSDMTLVDYGCNAGLFLKYAEDKGFNRVIGIDSEKEAVSKGLQYRDKVGGKYELKLGSIENVEVPLSDYTVFVNSHYYLNISDFVSLLDKLRTRTRYCLVVSGNKYTYPHIASSKADDLRRYFHDWVEDDGVEEIDGTGDPSPRRLWTLAFRSPVLKRVSMNGLDCGNNVQSSFYKEIDDGVPYEKMKYYQILKNYRLKENPESLSVWTKEQLDDFITKKAEVYWSVKNNGLKTPVIINKNGRILDGNHRFMMLKHLGHKTVLVREA